jgi:drug/metabolite transporter (DMT)-like permease
MIQRIQTIWLLLAAAASLASLKFSFYSGLNKDSLFTNLNGLSNFLLFIATVAVALAAIISIILFKNRKRQIQVVVVGLLLQAGVLVYYFLQTQQYKEGNYNLSSILSFAVPVFLILALMGIRKDEKIIKSMDRLR